MSRTKSAIKDWLPPAILKVIRDFRANDISFEGSYKTWEEASSKCTGYDAKPILEKVLDATLKVKRGDAAYERDSVLFDDIEYSWPITTGLMWAAARNSGVLDVLDFGGALGSSYFQNRAFLADLPMVRWSVIEQEHYVAAGHEYIEDETLRFYSSIESCLIENKPNVALLSCVMQYLPNIEMVIEEINSLEISTLIIDRTPFHDGKNQICIQQVPKSIYRASYPMRIFFRDIFSTLLGDWEVLAISPSPEGSIASNFGLTIDFCGYILKRKNA